MSSQSISPFELDFCGALTIVFIALKLCAVIDWSWWWVLSPMWVPLAIVLAVVAVYLLIRGLWWLGGF